MSTCPCPSGIFGHQEGSWTGDVSSVCSMHRAGEKEPRRLTASTQAGLSLVIVRRSTFWTSCSRDEDLTRCWGLMTLPWLRALSCRMCHPLALFWEFCFLLWEDEWMQSAEVPEAAQSSMPVPLPLEMHQRLCACTVWLSSRPQDIPDIKCCRLRWGRQKQLLDAWRHRPLPKWEWAKRVKLPGEAQSKK